MARLDRLCLWAADGLAAFLQPWALLAAEAATVAKATVVVVPASPRAGTGPGGGRIDHGPNWFGQRPALPLYQDHGKPAADLDVS
jgi:hypothetical protein